MKKLIHILFQQLIFILIGSLYLEAQYYSYPLDTNINNILHQFYLNFNGTIDTLEGGDFQKFQKWEQYWGPRLSPSGSFQKASDHIRSYVLDFDNRPRSVSSLVANWTEIGPKSNGLAGIGLVNDIQFHPNDDKILFCGSSGGGVWKSIDKGLTWLNLNTDFQLARLGVSTIAVDPINPNIIYIGTGDIDYEFCYSDGVYRTIDGGQTWHPINTGFLSSIDGLFLISKILVDPASSDIMYVAGTFGIYKCNNRASTDPLWFKVYPNNMTENELVRNIFFKPEDSDILYGIGIDIIKSENAGDLGTWYSIATQQTNLDLTNTPWPNAFAGTGFPYLEIMNMAVGPANQYLYVTCIARPNGPPWQWNTPFSKHVFRFDVTSSLWSEVSSGQPKMIYPGKHELVVSPDNDSIVLAGGIYAYASTNAGSTWDYFDSGAHPDYHSIIYSPYNEDELYFCTDGGIWRYNLNNSTSTELNNGLGVATVYYFGTSDINPDVFLAGMQDCGLNLLFDIWSHIQTTDGFECVLDYNNINIKYGTSYNEGNGSLYRNISPNSFWPKINNPAIEPSYWGAPLMMSNQNSKTLYQGRRNLWKVDDATVANPISFWYKNSDLEPIIENEFPNEPWLQVLRCLKKCETNEDYIYASVINAANDLNSLHNDCIIVKSMTGGGLNEEDWSLINPQGQRYFVRDLAVSPHDPNKIWLTYSSYEAPVKVVKSINGGLDWTNYGEGLPDLPVHCIVYEFGSNDRLFVGTEVGIYYRDDFMPQWEPFMNGFPNVVVNCLEINYSANKLRAGTFGRGIWETVLTCSNDSSQIVVNFNQIWKRNYKLSGTLIIQNGISLTIEKELNCTEGSKIIIERGGELIIDGGKITNNCGQMWQGIQVWGTASASQSTPGAQGKLTIINGGTIENAMTAVRLAKCDGPGYEYGYEGGIIQTDEAHFINNRTGIKFYPYRNLVSGVEMNNLSYFYRSEFLTDTELADESTPEDFIYLNGVKGINIKGCSFTNSRPEVDAAMSERGTGIYSNDASFFVTRLCESIYSC